jgi:GntR family transcriptional regulator
VALPTYLQLADQLEEDISALPAGSRLESEKDLAARLGVNRLTARAAVQELERRFRVRRRSGSGTFVSNRVECRITPSSPPSWTEAIRRAGAEPRQETLSLRTRAATAALRELLALPAGARVVHLARRRYVNGEPAALADTYLAADLVPGLRSHLPESGSLHKVLCETYNLDPVRVTLSFDMDVAPLEVAQALGLSTRPMMWHGVGISKSRRLNRLLNVTTGWSRPDVLRTVFDFSENP